MKHIRILSPAGAIEHDYIILAKNRLEAWGFCVSLSSHAFGEHGRFSGTPQDRLNDLNEAFADESVDIILCARGGYGLQQIVDKIILPTRPKDQWPLVVGFSDITALHALMSLNGVPSLHASMCKALATLPDESEALYLLHQALDGKYVSELPVAKGKKIIGGNLSVLYGLQGTPYSLNAIIDQCAEPPILLIEDICERHYHVDRMLNNLRMSGVLDRLAGVIVGQFTDCIDDPKMSCTLQDSIRDILADYDFPIVWNAPYGHIDENRPIMFSQTF